MVFTGSNQSPFLDLQCYYMVKSASLFDLQGFYRVKSVSLFRFTMFLQGQTSLPFSIYSVFTGSYTTKFLQFDWLRAVVFQLNLKYLHVKITNLLQLVV